ncbi:MAG: uncharacterized protein JWP52_3909, partial [Rhizobacter sp.]|nr:uncharacterized protein [Rhizobacter sp.]
MSEGLPPPMFVTESPALDFLNSVAVPLDTEVEWLGSGDDLLAWLQQAGLVQSDVLEDFRKTAGPGALDAVAAQARALREWFRGFVQKSKGRRLTRSAINQLEPLNRVLARDEVYGQIVPRAKQAGADSAVSDLEWVPLRRWRSPDALLLPIAKAMADLLTTADFTDVKPCEGHTCTLFFLDTTRGRKRRWCSMSVCGNRAKQAAH